MKLSVGQELQEMATMKAASLRLKVIRLKLRFRIDYKEKKRVEIPLLKVRIKCSR